MKQSLHAGLRSLPVSLADSSTAGWPVATARPLGGTLGAVQRLAVNPGGRSPDGTSAWLDPAISQVPNRAGICATTGAPQRSLNPKSKIRKLALKVCLSPDLISPTER